ncbi:hypothetical protein [Psychromonas sp. SA13A]|uniref:hypothetical protein n=1 Tax=Psychromonas sp. SA13A TaxID=2686346 RepID=UPI001409A567|nr:hypothetical protein [Psychromonas sp. SA13A]
MSLSQILIAVLFLSFSISGHAQEKPIIKLANQTKMELLYESNIRLMEQNRILQSTASDLRSTYHWALGFSATFLLLFLGVNIYFFRNRYNEEKEYLLMHIDDSIEIKKTEIDTSLANKLSEVESKLENKVSSQIEFSLAKVLQKIKLNANDIQLCKVEALKLKLINTNNSGVKENILSENFRLAVEIRMLSGKSWDWDVSNVLENINALLLEGTKFDPMEMPEVSTFLNNLPAQFTDQVTKIRFSIH